VWPEACVRATGAIASGFSLRQQCQRNKFKTHKKRARISTALNYIVVVVVFSSSFFVVVVFFFFFFLV